MHTAGRALAVLTEAGDAGEDLLVSAVKLGLG